MVVALAVAWAIRELVPVLRSRLANSAPSPTPSAVPSGADASGHYVAAVADGMATRRELEEPKQLVAELRAKVIELDKLLAVLTARFGAE